MKVRTQYLVAALLVAVAFGVSVFFYPQMPDRMATHWTTSGDADGTMGKLWGAFLLPTVTAVLLALFAVIPRIDPLDENISVFRKQYALFVVLFVAFMLYVHSFVILWNLGYRFDFTTVLAPAIGALFYFIGVLMNRVERNWFVGVRTPWTLSNDEVWKNTHSRAGPLFKLAGLVAIVGVFVPTYAIYLMVVPAVGIAIYLTVYSYVEYRRVTV
ncbi:SdpI family protein [Haladaptatus caseinilyticus]|uniref:SdpI family protein n=1 Tax=Haladaptatus caseinilyticus TaxID=2993314 RepID=UPI00224B45CF|nr:SdpI family protein [Haladaptatus caseinilyticus]